MAYIRFLMLGGVVVLVGVLSFYTEDLKWQIFEFKNKERFMIEVVEIEAVNKGSLLCKCDVHIKPWQLTLKGVCVFEKGANRWIALPSKEIDDGFGGKKYIETMTFDTDAVKNRFRNQIMGAIDKHLKENPEMKTKDVIQEDDLPF